MKFYIKIAVPDLNHFWAVRKLLANTQKMKYYNQDRGKKIFVSKSLTKEEQIKEKECLI